MQVTVSSRDKTTDLAQNLARSLRPHMILLSWAVYSCVTIINVGIDFMLIGIGLVLFVALYGIVALQNDLGDIETDKLNNRKDIPYSIGLLTESQLIWTMFALSIVVTLIGLLLSQLVLLWIGLYILLGYIYSGPLKVKSRGILAALLLGFCYGAVPWLIGASVSGQINEMHLIIAAFASFIFSSGIIVLKDFKDIKGDAATGKSKGNLKEEIDYFCISYKTTIINWLYNCLKEAADQPILRESIKQYIILIKKITNQLADRKMEKEIEDLIVKYYHSAKLIEANVWMAEQNAAHSLLIDIKTEIEKSLKEGWTITVDENLSIVWTGLRITHATWNGILVKLEGDSKVPWSRSYYGIVAPEKEYDRAVIKTKLEKTTVIDDSFAASWAWPYYKTIMSLQSNDDRMKLFDATERALLVKDVSDKLIELAKACELPLADIPRI